MASEPFWGSVVIDWLSGSCSKSKELAVLFRQRPLPGSLPRSSERAHPYIPSTALEQPNPIPLEGGGLERPNLYM